MDNLQKTNLVLTIALRAVALALLLLQALPAIFVLGLTFLMVASAAVIAVLSTVLR